MSERSGEEKGEGFGIIEIYCEDCDMFFYILSDRVSFCPYCGSHKLRFEDVRVEARYVSEGDGNE